MKVRPAEVIACQPFRHDAIQSRLGRIAEQYRLLVAGRRDRAPGNLIRQLEHDGFWIELDRMRGRCPDKKQRCECGEYYRAHIIHKRLRDWTPELAMSARWRQVRAGC